MRAGTRCAGKRAVGSLEPQAEGREDCELQSIRLQIQ